MRNLKRCISVAAVLFCLISADHTLLTAGESGESVHCKQESIKYPNGIFTKSNLHSKFDIKVATRPVKIDNGAISPKRSIGLSAAGTAEKTLAIGSRAIPVAIDRSKVILKNADKDGKKDLTLKPTLNAFANAEMEFEDGVNYELAFPIAELDTSEGLLAATANFRYRSGFTIVGKLGGDSFHLYDDNLDGVFDLQKDMYTIGKAQVFAPLTEQIAMKSALVKIQSVTPDGSELVFQEIPNPDSGNISIDHELRKTTTSLVVISTDGRTSFIDQGTGRATHVPPGSYQITYGLVYANKDKRVAAVVMGHNVAPLQIQAGKDAEVTFGEELKLQHFKVSLSGSSVTVDPTRTWIEGKAGERYYGYQVITPPAVGVAVIDANGREKIHKLGVCELNAERTAPNKSTVKLPVKGEEVLGDDVVAEGGRREIVLTFNIWGIGEVEGRAVLE